MKPRLSALAVLAALLGSVLLFAFHRDKTSSQKPKEPPASTPSASTQGQSEADAQRRSASQISTGSVPTEPGRAQPAEIGAGGVAILPDARNMVIDFNHSDFPPSHDLELLDEIFSRYRQMFGQNPSGGTNAEIAASLTGTNLKKLAIIPPAFSALNAQGELTDRWGTPYFFHPVSGSVMEVLSAGPDALLWTEDDIGAITPAGQEAQSR